jgi:hypothetical protein
VHPGAAVAMGAHAQAHAGAPASSASGDVLAAIAALREGLARQVPGDDDEDDVFALVDVRLRRLEEAAAAKTPEEGRIRHLLGQLTSGLSGVAAVAGAVEALRTAVEKLLA